MYTEADLHLSFIFSGNLLNTYVLSSTEKQYIHGSHFRYTYVVILGQLGKKHPEIILGSAESSWTNMAICC